MLELASCETTIIHCFAEAPVLDAVQEPAGTIVFRVANRELICLSARAAANRVFAALSAKFTSGDPYALLLDRSDAWAVITLNGDERAKAFSRLCTSPLSPAPAFLQGAICGVPGKVVNLHDRIYLLVSSVLRDHLRHSILDACRDLGLHETSAGEFSLEESVSV